MTKTSVSVAIISILLLVTFAFTQSVCAESDLAARLSQQVDKAPNASAELKTLIKTKLIPLCSNEIFAKSVAAQNSRGTSLDAIKEIDEQWLGAEDELPIQKELLSNSCADEIRRIAQSITSITETFVMDKLGANVGQNALTSDYWQGDESKFTNSFADGKGGVEIEDPKLDKSTNRVDQKVSLPIVDGSGAVIGAICIGVSL